MSEKQNGINSFVVALCVSLAAAMSAQDAHLPPANATAKLGVRGVGVQRYACQLREGSYAWVLQEPIADLQDPASSATLGKHSKGPTWTWNDGSRITGTLVQQQPSPDAPASIAWLWLRATNNGPAGALSDVTYIRRSETRGGAAPSAGCTQQSSGTVSDVSYQATYTFYTSR